MANQRKTEGKYQLCNTCRKMILGGTFISHKVLCAMKRKAGAASDSEQELGSGYMEAEVDTCHYVDAGLKVIETDIVINKGD